MGEGMWTCHLRGGLVEYVFYPIIFHKFRPLPFRYLVTPELKRVHTGVIERGLCWSKR